jgi:hypothetical protein
MRVIQYCRVPEMDRNVAAYWMPGLRGHECIVVAGLGLHNLRRLNMADFAINSV